MTALRINDTPGTKYSFQVLREVREREWRIVFVQPLPHPPTMPSSLLLFLALCGLLVSASAHQVNLYHRVFVPSVSSRGHPAILPPWVPRGTAEILSSRFAKYAPVSNLDEHLALYRSEAASNQPLALYQVALELPGVPPNLWPFSSVKAVCSYIPASLRLCEDLQRPTVPDSRLQVPPHRQDYRLNPDSRWRRCRTYAIRNKLLDQ